MLDPSNYFPRLYTLYFNGEVGCLSQLTVWNLLKNNIFSHCFHVIVYFYGISSFNYFYYVALHSLEVAQK